MTRPTFSRAEAAEVLRALDAVATADKSLLDDERAFLFSFAERNGLPLDDVRPPELDTPRLALAIPDVSKRKEVVRLCLEMAHVDFSYPPNENILIWRLARDLGLSDHDLADLTDDVRGDDMPEQEF